MIGAFMVASWPIIMLFGILTMSCGLMFGIPIGVTTTLVGAVIGGTSVFLLSRFVFRARVEKWVETGEWLQLMECPNAVANDAYCCEYLSIGFVGMMCILLVGRGKPHHVVSVRV
jgi:hypothetical protein